MYCIDDDRTLSFVFHLYFHLIPNSQRIGAGDIIYFKNTFEPGIKDFPALSFTTYQLPVDL